MRKIIGFTHNNNNLYATYKLGKDSNFKIDKKKSKDYFIICVLKNFLLACYELGDFYETQKNIYLALKYYEKALSNNDSDAYYRLFEIYLHGKVVEKDIK